MVTLDHLQKLIIKKIAAQKKKMVNLDDVNFEKNKNVISVYDLD